MQGIAIDEAEIPEWARPLFSAEQLTLSRALLWAQLVYRSKRLESSGVSVAQRLYMHVVGREKKAWNPSQAGLAEDLNLSVTTVAASLDQLEEEGWLVVGAPSGRKPWYHLAWPQRDVLAPVEPLAVCGMVTKKGKVCERRAGRGTKTPGVGPCHLHGGSPKNEPDDHSGEELEGPAEPVGPQPLGVWEAFDPQPLGVNGGGSAPTTGDQTPNRWSRNPQPLGGQPPTAGDVYVPETFSVRSESIVPVRSVGALTARTARAADTPPANRERSPDQHARRIITATPRYATAPRWVRRHLIAAIVEALEAGYGPDAIRRYAAMVIHEQRYAEHQHTLELAAALGRLKRDVELGDACEACGLPECDCRTPAVEHSEEITITPEELERLYAHHGVTPADLTQEIAA